MISSKADVHPKSLIGKDVSIGPFSVIYDDVVIEDGTNIANNVTLYPGTRIGANCEVYPGAVIGAAPQDLKYQGEKTYVEIGDNTKIRECCTINRGTKAAGITKVGSNCLLMAYVHVAHDCMIGDRTIIANSVNMAGHVEIGHHCVIAGMVAIQQFVRIGDYAMVTGGSLVRKDVPPYIRVAREPLAYIGVNTVGLQRNGFEKESIDKIQMTYTTLFNKGMNSQEAIVKIESMMENNEEQAKIVAFIQSSKNGTVRGPRLLSSDNS